MFAHPLGDDAELRLLELRHAEAFFMLIDSNRAHLREWLPWVDGSQSPSDTAAFIRSTQHQWADLKGMSAGIWCQGRPAGVISFNTFNWLHRSATIGYWLAAEFQGQGLMTRATRACTDHALTELGLHRVEIRCATGNARSRAIPERLGYTLEGISRDAERLYDHFVDHAIYAMLAPDWRHRGHQPAIS